LRPKYVVGQIGYVHVRRAVRQHALYTTMPMGFALGAPRVDALAVAAAAQRGLQHAGVLAEPVGDREDVAALLAVHQYAQLGRAEAEAVLDAARPVGVVIAQHAARRVHARPAGRREHEAALVVTQVAVAEQRAVRVVLDDAPVLVATRTARLDVEAPVRAEHQRLQVAVQLAHLAVVLAPVDRHVPVEAALRTDGFAISSSSVP
jgi:hypothetical protein